MPRLRPPVRAAFRTESRVRIPPARVAPTGGTTASSGDLTIDTRETATVNLTSLNQVYNGNARPVTATTNPPGLGVIFTYEDLQPRPPSPEVTRSSPPSNDPGYRGTANGTLVIAKAAQSISFPSIPAQLATAT